MMADMFTAQDLFSCVRKLNTNHILLQIHHLAFI